MAGLTFGQGGARAKQAEQVFQNFLNTDPEIQQLIQQYKAKPKSLSSIGDLTNAIVANVQKRGLPALPDGFNVSAEGKLAEQGSFLEYLPLAIAGIVGPYAIGSSVAGGAPAAASTAGGETAAGTLPSTAITLPVEDTALTSVGTAGADASAAAVGGGAAAGEGAATSGGILGKPTYSQIANLLKAGGQGIGSASTASQNNQQIRGNNQVKAATALEDAYLSDAALEQKQRANELRDTYRQGVVSSGAHSPYDPVAPSYGADYLASSAALSKQGAADLAQAPIYGIRNIPNPKALGYPDPNTTFAETGMQQVGDWLGPTLTIAGNIPPSTYARLFSML